MSNVDEQLSALMDGEESDINLVLNSIQDKDVRGRWNRYHLIRDIMRNQISTVDKSDISQQIHNAIIAEPTMITSSQFNKRSKAKSTARSNFVKQLGGMAIAATVTAVAILVVQQNPGLEQNTVIAQTPNLKQQNIQTVASRNIQLNKAVAAKLNSYLINHNEYAGSSGMQGAIPYSRVVNFNPTIRSVRVVNAK